MAGRGVLRLEQVNHRFGVDALGRQFQPLSKSRDIAVSRGPGGDTDDERIHCPGREFVDKGGPVPSQVETYVSPVA